MAAPVAGSGGSEMSVPWPPAADQERRPSKVSLMEPVVIGGSSRFAVQRMVFSGEVWSHTPMKKPLGVG